VQSEYARLAGMSPAALTAAMEPYLPIVLVFVLLGGICLPFGSGWSGALFPTGPSGLGKINVAQWRNDASGPMRVVSGPYGREKIHYEAPAADRLDDEMRGFLTWFNLDDQLDPVTKPRSRHLWFVTIHPFDDGNGRIARAIADMSLARSEDSPQRFYSMSAQIQLERQAYYDMLEATQKGDLDITRWLEWFLACLDRAFDGAEAILSSVFRKAEFWWVNAATSLNDRQRDILNRLLDGFEGKLTSSKWAKIEKCSPDTALRDINELVAYGILARDEAGGRSTSYSLTEIKADR
jgi:Fic family protein